MDRIWHESLNLEYLLEKFGSPQYILSEEQLRSNFSYFKKFTGDSGEVFYPVKANPHLMVLRLLASFGSGADCSSAHEVNLSLLAGIPLRKIIYTSPAPDLDYALKLLNSGANVVIDNEEDLLVIDELLKGQPDPSGKIFLRINPDFPIFYGEKASYQDLTGHAAESSKFGISAEDIEKVTTKVNLKISGLHLHVGTQMDHLGPFKKALQHLHLWAEQLKKLGHPITILNLGGGLGIPFSKEASFPSLSEYVENLSELKKSNEFQYAVEPGHALVGNAVGMISKVLKIKPSRGKKWAVIDVGTDQLAKVTLLKWPHRVFSSQGELSQTGPDILAGPMCFGGDNLLTATDVSKLKKGDPVFISMTGAYCYSLGNRFNGKLSPGMILISSTGEMTLVQEKEHPNLDPNIQAHLWVSTPEEKKNVDAHSSKNIEKEMYRLGSPYLWHLAAADQYKITEAKQIGEREFEFKIITRAAVNFISAPFALRIVGDCCIMSTLRILGRTEKSVPVWGKTIVMECAKEIKVQDELDCKISLSFIQDPIGRSRKAFARFDLDQGKFCGQIEMVCS